MAFAERKTPALRASMKRAGHAFLTSASPMKSALTVNVSLKNVLTVRTRLMGNALISANA